MVNFLTLPTPLTVQRVGTPTKGMTKLEIFLLTTSVRVAMMLKLSRNFSRCKDESFVNNSTETDEDARLDVIANGLWGSRFSRTFFDVQVFKQHAKTSRRLPKDAYKYHESLKTQNTYREFNKAEQSSFCPLSFGCTGGA